MGSSVPPYAAGGSTSSSVGSTSMSTSNSSQFPTTPTQNSVGVREAGHISKSLALEPVRIDNTSSPVTVQQAWDSFNTMSAAQRKTIQQQMFDGGFLTKQSDVSGDVNTASLNAWRNIVTEASNSGNSIQAHLDISQSSGVYSQMAADIQKQQKTLQNEITAPKNLNIPLTNDAVLRAYLQAGFTQALGHSPSEQELDTFVQTFHNQEIAAGETQLSEPRQYAQQQLDRTNNSLAQLNALGPNGLDAFVQAYKSVMSGTNPTGNVNAPPSLSPFQQAVGQQPNPLAPLVTSHGGPFAFSPQTWATEVKAAGFSPQKYPTATSAPDAVQTAVFSRYADDLFQKYGNWSDVASVAAGGKPGDPFGSRVAAEVNDKLTTFTTQANAPGPDNIVASATADTSGQAAKQAADQAAKETDPVGYYAHQVSLYEGLLNKIAGGGGGLPQQDITASTVSGPVAPIAAPTPAAAQVGA